MHYEARRIIRCQIAYYSTKHLGAISDEAKEKYAKLVLEWAAKLESENEKEK
jgi:hypothetical protein